MPRTVTKASAPLEWGSIISCCVVLVWGVRVSRSLGVDLFGDLEVGCEERFTWGLVRERELEDGKGRGVEELDEFMLMVEEGTIEGEQGDCSA